MALTLHGTVSDNTVALDRKTATPLIINGDMAIDQRNSGSSVTGSDVYPVDRFNADDLTDGAYTAQQSTDVPTGEGFINSVKLTVTSTDTDLGTTQFSRFSQVIEGHNISHLLWGTSNAKTITVSFWVKSSVNGTYDFSLQNDDSNRTYMTSYTINSANTWEKKTITIAGDTSGTWKTDNDRGIKVFWGLGTGTTYQTSTTGWQSANVLGLDTPNVNFLATSGATFYITGVQLEIGTFDANSIPPFQFEDRATSLARCQRYYYQVDSGATIFFASAYLQSSTDARGTVQFPVEMRGRPTVVSSSTSNGFQFVFATASDTCNDLEYPFATARNKKSALVRNNSVSGFTAGQAGYLRFNGGTPGTLGFDSEL